MYEPQAILNNWCIIAVIYNGDSAKAPSRHFLEMGRFIAASLNPLLMI